MKISLVYLRKCPQPVRVHLPAELDVETQVRRNVSSEEGDFEDLRTESAKKGYLVVTPTKVVEIDVTPDNMKIVDTLISGDNPMFRLRYEQDIEQVRRYVKPSSEGISVEAEDAVIVEPAEEAPKPAARRGRPKKTISKPKSLKVEKAAPAGENE